MRLHLLTMTMAALLGLGLAVSSASAQQTAADQEKEQPQPLAFKASDLLGLDVRNEAGDEIGELNDLVVDVKGGRVPFAAVSVVDVEDELFLVPFQMLNWQRESDEQGYHAVADRETLQNAPGFNKDRWPNLASEEWMMMVRDKFGADFAVEFEAENQVMRASQILGMTTQGEQDEDLGEIEDIVVEAGTGEIRYAALASGGFLGIGEKLFAIPWNAFSLSYDSGDEKWLAKLDVNRQTLQDAEGFKKDAWPQFASDRWTAAGRAPAEHVELAVHRVSQLIGATVRNQDGEELGEINDLVLDLTDGRVRYAALAFAGEDDRLFAVPWAAFQLRLDPEFEERTVMLDIQKQNLAQAPGFDRDQWPSLADMRWAMEAEEFYGVEAETATADHPGYRASEVLDLAVEDQNGDEIGDMNDLLAEAKQGSVTHAVISMEDRERLFPIPWSKFELRQDEQNVLHALVLTVDPQELANAPSFTDESWPDFSDPNWSEDFDQFYGTEPERTARRNRRSL